MARYDTSYWTSFGTIIEACLPSAALLDTNLLLSSLTSAHTGAYLAEKVVECLKAYRIQDKVRISSAMCSYCLLISISQVLAVTCDNAESNAIMLREMMKLLPGFHGAQVRVRCFGHVLNLVVKVRNHLRSIPARVSR